MYVYICMCVYVYIYVSVVLNLLLSLSYLSSPIWHLGSGTKGSERHLDQIPCPMHGLYSAACLPFAVNRQLSNRAQIPAEGKRRVTPNSLPGDETSERFVLQGLQFLQPDK